MEPIRKPKPLKKPYRKNGTNKRAYKRPGPRSTYDPDIHIPIARHITFMGGTGVDVAKACNVLQKTIATWQKRFPEFAECMKVNTRVVSDQVRQALINKCLGYEYDEVSIEEELPVVGKMPMYAQDGSPMLDSQGRPKHLPIYGDSMIIVKRRTTRKRVLPDLGSIVFWMANRDRWDDGSPIWLRSDPQGPRPGENDELKNPEKVAEYMEGFSDLMMEAV